MDPKLTPQKIAADFERNGAFATINDYVERKIISTTQAERWIQQMFELYAAKAQEAQKELARLQAASVRLSQVAKLGSRRRPFNNRDPLILSLAHELTTFDNWVMSLYETDLSMISYGAPERARAKPVELQRAMDALYRKRTEAASWALKAPELFTRG